MKLSKSFAIVAAFAAVCQAQSLTGRWEARVSPVDETRKMVLAVTQNGNTLTGYLIPQQNNAATPIVESTVSGNEITIVIERPGRGGRGPATPGAPPPPPPAPVRVTYTAVLQGDKLLLTMPPNGRGGNGQPQIREFTRVSTDVPGPMPTPPKRIALGEYKPVPDNGMAKTPPMGWNSWNKFAERVTDKDVRGMADAMVSSGMKDAGYIYINIDDTWELDRDAQGNIRTNSKFPDMKALADYVHGKGLKLGIYSSPGPYTCAGYPGSFGHEMQDAKSYAAWGIDYLKYDWCSGGSVYENGSQQAAYAIMGDALAKSGRKILYSLCQYGQFNVGEWGANVGGNIWRTTGDIRDSWDSMMDIGFRQQVGREKFAKPGHWNDPDMLEIGNGGMTDTEYKTHMSLWSLLAAGLLAGNDIRTMTPSIKEILTNKEVIAIDQDKLGKQAVRVSPPVPAEEADTISVKEGRSTTGGDLQVFSRPLADGGWAVGLFNLSGNTAKVTAKWSDLGIKGSHKVRDLWEHADKGAFADEFSADVPSHGVVMIKIAK
jgi:alpha-galactosidase